jgi:hypothetical protein
MATVEQLVQKLGKPPREICLDWVWQIEHLPNPSGIGSEKVPELSMSDLEVDATGQLQLRDHHSGRYSRLDLVEELRHWSVVPPKMLVEPLQKKLDEPIELAKSHEYANFEKRSVASRLKRPAFNKRRNGKLPKQVATAVTGVFLAVFVFFAWTGLSDRVASQGGGAGLANATKQGQETAKPLAELKNQTLEDFSLQPSAPKSVPETLEMLKTPEPDVGVSEATDSTTSPWSDLDSKLPNLLAADGKAPPSTMNEGAPGSESNQASVQAMSERDVMKEVADLAQDASKDAIETDIQQPQNGSFPNEPIVIHTSPMVQVMKFASPLPNRSRQAMWKLELLVDDGFIVTPDEPQRLKDRQTVTWNIVMDDAELPATRLVIAVDIPSRQTSLRWRMAATADDFPQLNLPLDTKLLQMLQDRMRFFAQQADRMIETIKQSSSSLPREMRFLAAKQRSDLEAQSKLAKRLLTIASGAALINDQLHGHVSVRAESRASEE